MNALPRTRPRWPLHAPVLVSMVALSWTRRPPPRRPRTDKPLTNPYCAHATEPRRGTSVEQLAAATGRDRARLSLAPPTHSSFQKPYPRLRHVATPPSSSNLRLPPSLSPVPARSPPCAGVAAYKASAPFSASFPRHHLPSFTTRAPPKRRGAQLLPAARTSAQRRRNGGGCHLGKTPPFLPFSLLSGCSPPSTL
jgi:hypothetical protein